MSLKYPVTPPEIDLGTVRLVVQRVNHYATPGPSKHSVVTNIEDYITSSFVKYLIYSYLGSSAGVGNRQKDVRHRSRRSLIDKEQKPLFSSKDPDRL